MNEYPVSENVSSTSDQLASKVVPLLQQLNRVEDSVAALAMRLDPVVNHATASADTPVPVQSTVTARLQKVGDTLQYLLDNIEL